MAQQEEKAITLAFFGPPTTRQRGENRRRDSYRRGRGRGHGILTNRSNNIITTNRGRGRGLGHDISYARGHES